MTAHSRSSNAVAGSDAGNLMTERKQTERIRVHGAAGGRRDGLASARQCSAGRRLPKHWPDARIRSHPRNPSSVKASRPVSKPYA